MKKSFTIISLFFFIGLILSCSNELEEPLQILEEQDDEGLTELSFIYKGEKYYSKCFYEGEKLCMEDEDVEKIWAHLGSIPTIASLVHEEQLFYFDSYEEMDNYLGFPKESMITRAVGDTYLELVLYENTGLKKVMESHKFTYKATLNVPKMSKRDKLSSLSFIYTAPDNPYKGVHAKITLYDYYDYVGESITFTNLGPTYAVRYNISNLKNYPMVKGGNWNDEAASYKFETHW